MVYKNKLQHVQQELSGVMCMQLCMQYTCFCPKNYVLVVEAKCGHPKEGGAPQSLIY